MPKIYLEINQAIEFHIDIYDTEIGDQFFKQHLAIAAQDPVGSVAVITDFTKYNIRYFQDLIKQAHQSAALDWSQYVIKPGPEHFHSNQVQFNAMHKDLEVVAGLNRYAGLNADQIKLVDELHCCLHSLETMEAPLDYNFTQRNYVNMSYFTSVPENNHMPKSVKFSRTIQPGEIMLDYPYVGKEPFFCMMHNDNSILQQTCKIIDRVSLNWKLHLDSKPGKTWGPPPWPADVDAELTAWYYKNQADMDVLGYSLQKIIDHTGFCIPGRIDNLSTLEYMRTVPNIQITGYQLIN